MTRWGRAALPDGSIAAGLVEDEAFVSVHGDPFAEHRRAKTYTLDEVTLLSPSEPRTILLMWRAFVKPGDPPVDYPPYLAAKAFGVPPGGPDSPIVVPELVGGPLAAEAELAVVIGRRATGLAPEQAWDAIAGFTVMNDVTSPALIHPAGTWPDELPRLVSGAVLAKSFDGFAPFGPWIETGIDDTAIRDGLAITTRVNGVEQMRGTTRDFKFPVAEVVSHASRVLTLHPGDVITLGTPGIVLVDDGDVVECEVEGVGTLRNAVTTATHQTSRSHR
ncbi:fumarylacetoacetate hydrolase family protein [Nocardioides sp. QY071]|uniref:fumarylacetoacetate hydrolase family protein n=1 Tax=Nocardioides sp. QY071 TaxID=3044187 RepID=UPI00249B5C5A|nr:fumarylacetoacetate hydrolase family protein [Nocardioides sp. QY071]WGY00378.1 fumarylacetoacetate hydrolase family protein [Nocardioides sp. QY071]